MIQKFRFASNEIQQILKESKKFIYVINYMSTRVFYLLLVSFNHIGDLNQAKYTQINVKNKYKEELEVKIYDVETLDFEQIKQFRYYHCFGEKGLNFINNLKKNGKLEGKTIIAQIHQHFPILFQLQPQYLIIPKSTYLDHQSLQKTHKFLLNEILFEKYSQDELKKIYQNSEISKKIILNQQYIIIMLSGDAPDQKQMKYFTKESVDILFYRLIFLLGRLSCNHIYPKVIVQNGPRTGYHNPETGKQTCNHSFIKDKQSPEKAIDQISLYFISKLQKAKIKYDFFNFSFEIIENGRKINSFYKPLLYIGMMKQNYFLFPMQSVSMCSQLPFYIQSSRLIAYHTSSTNEQHMKVVNEGFIQGRFQKMDQSNDGIGKLEYNQKSSPKKYNQIQQILDHILKQIRDQNK